MLNLKDPFYRCADYSQSANAAAMTGAAPPAAHDDAVEIDGLVCVRVCACACLHVVWSCGNLLRFFLMGTFSVRNNVHSDTRSRGDGPVCVCTCVYVAHISDSDVHVQAGVGLADLLILWKWLMPVCSQALEGQIMQLMETSVNDCVCSL